MFSESESSDDHSDDTVIPMYIDQVRRAEPDEGILMKCNQILWEYEQRSEEIPLSVIYEKSGCPGLANYHQILEVLSLLFRRRGLWAFLFIKMVSFLRLDGVPSKYLFRFCRAVGIPMDVEDVAFLWGNTANFKQSLQDQLEREFFETVEEIQGIIGWKEFAVKVREMVQSIKETDYRAVCKDHIN